MASPSGLHDSSKRTPSVAIKQFFDDAVELFVEAGPQDRTALYIDMSSMQKHPYHLVDPSPWPLVSSISCLVAALGAATFFHSFHNGDKVLSLGLVMVIFSMSI